MNRNRMVFVFIISVVFLPVLTFAKSDVQAQAASPVISFYGRVVDNDNEPVKGAYITARIATADTEAKLERVVVQTDAQGRFIIHGSGDSLEILSVRKNKYFFFKDKQQQYTYQYRSTDDKAVFTPDKKTPVIFHMDKQGKPEKIQIYRSLQFWPDKEAVYNIDLASEGKPRLKKAKMPDHILNIPEVRKIMQEKKRDIDIPADTADPNTIYDIRATAVFANDPNAVLTFEALTPQTGLVVMDALTGKAPQDGYHRQVQIQTSLQKTGVSVNKYIYVKARNGEIVSQVSLSLIPSPEELTVKAVIKSNLDGSMDFIASSFDNAPGTKTWREQQKRMQKAREKHDIRNEKGN
jgi:hypothetical protein